MDSNSKAAAKVFFTMSKTVYAQSTVIDENKKEINALKGDINSSLGYLSIACDIFNKNEINKEENKFGLDCLDIAKKCLAIGKQR